MQPMHLKQKLILMQLTIILVHYNCRSNFYEHETKLLVLFMVSIVGLVFFFKWDFSVLEYIQLSYVRSLRKILIFILFINIAMCRPFVNMDIACFKMSF
jgi:hypothetical protein